MLVNRHLCPKELLKGSHYLIVSGPILSAKTPSTYHSNANSKISQNPSINGSKWKDPRGGHGSILRVWLPALSLGTRALIWVHGKDRWSVRWKTDHSGPSLAKHLAESFFMENREREWQGERNRRETKPITSGGEIASSVELIITMVAPSRKARSSLDTYCLHDLHTGQNKQTENRLEWYVGNWKHGEIREMH